MPRFGMASLARYGREVTTVFDLLGRTEPALTAALGWTMIRSPRLLEAVLTRLELPATPSEAATVHLETADKAGRTDIELHTPTARVIIEAKQGWILPGMAQLEAYAPRFSEGAAAELASRFVTLSDSTAAWAHQALPGHIAGVPVIHWSWDEVRELISEARGSARGHERNWLDQMEAYMGSATSKRPVTDSLAYCIVITDDLFGDVSFRDYVVKQRVYFHPLSGGGWPTVPPNFLAFRWKGAVRQVNRVLKHEIIARLSDRYPRSRRTTRRHLGRRRSHTSSTTSVPTSPSRTVPSPRTARGQSARAALLGTARPAPDAADPGRGAGGHQGPRSHLSVGGKAG